MTRFATPKLAGYAGLVGVSLLSALALRRPELVAIAAAFTLPLALSLAFDKVPQIRIDAAMSGERALQGDVITLTLDVEGDPVERLELIIETPYGIEVVEGSSRLAIRLEREESRTIELGLRCVRWGAYVFGGVYLRAHDRFGSLVHDQRLEPTLPLKVYPHAETLRALLRPQETQVFAGNQVARARGEGIEFADLRPFAPGDRDARPRRRGGRLARRAVSAAQGPRRPRQLRRRPQLADPGHRRRPALPDRGFAARHGDSAELRLEGPRRHPRTDAAAEGADRRAHAADRQAVRCRADRPPPSRLRSRSDRDRPGAVRRPGSRGARAAGIPALAPAPRGAARRVRAGRRSRGAVAGRRVPAGRPGGGALVQAASESRPRVAA